MTFAWTPPSRAELSATYAAITEPIAVTKARRPLPAPLTYYRCARGSSISTAAPPLTQFICHPFMVHSVESYDRITAEVTVAGAAGSVVRLGVYTVNEATGMPTDLVFDASTIDGTIVAVQQLTIALTLQPGTYAIGGVCQSSSTTLRVLYADIGGSGQPSPAGYAAGGWVSFAAGALPSTFLPVGAASYGPLVYLRRSA